MSITRVHAGFVLIGVSILLFLIAGSIDDFETQMSVAGEAFLGNFLSIAAFAFIGVGIFTSLIAACPALYAANNSRVRARLLPLRS